MNIIDDVASGLASYNAQLDGIVPAHSASMAPFSRTEAYMNVIDSGAAEAQKEADSKQQ